MPTCIVCKGEYYAPDWQCSKCGANTRNWEQCVPAFLVWLIETVRSLGASNKKGEQDSPDRPDLPADTAVPPELTWKCSKCRTNNSYSEQDIPAPFVRPWECSKCGTNNKRWETERTCCWILKALQFFGGVWGVLALISLALPLVSIVAYDYIQPVASVRIGVPLAVILCFVIFLFTHALRFSAREYELLRQVRKGRQPTLALMALVAFTLALVMALAVVFVLEAHEMEARRLEALDLKARKLEVLYLEALDLARKLESLDLARKLGAFYLEALDLKTLDRLSPTGGLTRVILTVFFSVTFVNVTLSAMLMSIRSFARRLNELVPQPIFLRDDLLVDVIIRAAQEQLGGGTTLSLVGKNWSDEGGIKASVEDSVQGKQWELEADQWARRLSVKRPKTW